MISLIVDLNTMKNAILFYYNWNIIIYCLLVIFDKMFKINLKDFILRDLCNKNRMSIFLISIDKSL